MLACVWSRFTADKKRTTDYIDTYDTRIYFEFHGSGQPLLLPHDDLASVDVLVCTTTCSIKIL